MTINMYDLFHETAQRQPNYPVVLGPLAGATLTYRQLDEAIVSASDQLKDAGVHPGACVGLHFPSSRDYIVWNYAIWRCGGCVVPIPTELSPNEKREICRQIAVTHLLSQQKVPAFAQEFKAGESSKLVGGADLMRLTSPQTHPPGFAALNAAFIRFTSGTTGASKGVVLSHESIQERIGAANTALQIGPADRIVWVLSMSYHFTVSIVAYLTFGATIVLPANHFAQALLAATETSEATILYASPAHYAFLADAPLGGSLSGLRLAISTTSTLDAKVAGNFERRYARPISQALGIIEIGLPAINCTGSRPESVGPVLPAYELRLEDAGLGPELQEVLLRGPGFLDAYYHPWQTRSQIMPDGWFRTGDVGHLDSEGRLCLRGRLKDVISVMGMKFFPQEVERVLAAHPEVAGVCVFARSHERLGEAPHAKVVARNGADRGKLAIELRKYCRERLASYKVPEQIEFVPALPRTASGKVLHRLT
jgi:long-chain acyl-CoA synthetase